MLLFLYIFCLWLQLTNEICLNQNFEEELDVKEENIDIWITYQSNKEHIKDLDNIIAQILTLNQTYSIKAQLTRNQFKFYSDDLKEFKSQNITASQSQYFSINIKLPQYTDKLKIKYNIFFDKQIVLRICSNNNFLQGPVVNNFNQDLFRYQERIIELDNNKLYFQIWMKEIAPSHFNSQSIHIVQYKDFVQTRENEIKFTHEFLFKRKKLLIYNQNVTHAIELLVSISIQLNEIRKFIIQLRAIYSEYYQLQNNYSYSFNTGIHLLLKNTIFAQFRIIQDYKNNSFDFQLFCQPDCLRCDKLICQECKNNLVLINGLCSCEQNMFSTDEGICKYPPQILILQEKDLFYDYNICRFGYYFDNRIKACRECSYFSGQQYYNCLSTQKINLNLQKCKRCSDLNIFSKPQLVEYCQFGFFLISGQCRKCPINCDACELNQNYQIECLYCDNSLIINNLCQKCSLLNCELCVSVNNAQICKLCKDQYSLNELKYCIYTNLDQFDQLKIQLQQDFQLTKNLYDENCELFSQETQQCVFCVLGFQNIQQQCLKCENEFVQQVFDKNNILGQKQYTNIVDKDFKLKLKQSNMANNQKCYNDTSQHIQLIKYNQLEINNQKYYFNQIQQDQISFCHSDIDCFNFMIFDAELVLVEGFYYVTHSNRYFKNIYNMVNTIQNYNIYMKEYHINIYNKGSLNITVNQFNYCFQLNEYSTTPINLNLDVNITITNNQSDNFITLDGYKIIKMNGIKFNSTESFTFNIDSKELIMLNFQFYSSLTFVITSSYYVVFNDSQIINVNANNNLFYFDCDLYFQSSRISFVNSTFNESIVFGFYRSLQKGWITDYSLRNIIFKQSRFFQAYNSSNIWGHFQNFNFNNITMSSSEQFLFYGDNNDDAIYTRAVNFLYQKIIVNRSILFWVSTANLMNITFHNLELTESSKVFYQSYVNDVFDVQLFNITFNYIIVYTQSRLLALANQGSVQIKLFKIFEIQFIFDLFELELNSIFSPEVEIKQYSIVNTEFKLNLRRHMLLNSNFININDYQIRGVSDKLIQMNCDLALTTENKLVLQNLIYDNIMITDNQLIFIQTFRFKLKITITNCYFNVAMIFQNYTQVIDEIKSSIIQVDNNKECQFHLLQSQFKIQYVKQNIKKLRQKLIVYLKGTENLQWNYHIIIKDCIFNIINNDRNMANYFSLSGTIIKIFNLRIQIKESFQLDQHQSISQIFMIFGNQITINTIAIHQTAFPSATFNIQDFALEKQSIIQLANINVLTGSSIGTLIHLQTKYATQATLYNISIQCYIVETLLCVYLPQENTFLLIVNFTCDLIYYNRNNFLIELLGSSHSEIKIIDFKIIGSHKIKSIGNGLVMHANFGYVTLENFMIADFLMSAAQILADYIYIDKFKIINCMSGNNMITISEQAYVIFYINQYQIITILRLFLTANKVYNSSLVYMDLNCSHLAIFRDWRVLNNEIHKSLLHVKLQNQSYYPQAQIRFVKLKIIDNTCDNCIILESLESVILKIIESNFINNFGNNIIQFDGLYTTIIDSSIINKINDHRTILIKSNIKLKIINTIIFSIKSIVFQIPVSYMEMAIINKLFVIKEQYDEQTSIVTYKHLDPDILKLTFTNENQLQNLLQSEINNKTVFLNNPVLLKVDLIYFPSGQSLKEYRVLIINSKSYSNLLQNFQLFGFNINNNLIISINTCQINLLDKEQVQLANIQVLPATISENQTFMDLIFIGNPYASEVFTFEAVCNFSNTTLVFQQNIKLFKCQLGEYFNENKCKKCDIDRGFYSVQKRSQKCKSVNYDIIEQINHGLIKLKSGHWRPHYSNDQIEICNQNPQNCLGGWDVGFASCQKGYLGALCQECDLQNIRGDGHYGKLQQNCYLCKFSFGIIFKVFFFILFQLLTIIIATRSHYMICQRYQNLIVSNKFYRILNKLSIDQPSVLIKQIQNYFFYIQFISQSFQIDLQVESLLKIISNPISLANPHYDCMINNFETPELITKIIIQVITPSLILILFYILFLMMNSYLKLKFIFIFIFLPLELLFIIYSIGIFQFVIGLITHVKISGIWWIQTYRSIEYFNKNNIPLFILIAVIILILIIIIPLFILIILQLRKNQLLEKNWIIKFGYLYQEYQVKIYYWEFIKMGLKVIFTTQTMLLLNASDIKYIVTVLLIVFQSEIIKQFQPFYLKNLNQYDRKFHLLLLVTTLNFILVHLSNDFQQIILTLILYLVNAIYFLIIIKFMIKKYIQGNPILFDKLKLLVSKNSSENDSYQLRKSQTKKRFLMMKRYAKSQTSYKINQQQYTQMQQMIKSNAFSNLSEAVNQELELIPIPQKETSKRNKQSRIIQQNQFQNNEIELQYIPPNIKQISIEDLPQSDDNQLPE